jgi:hypothetical protein
VFEPGNNANPDGAPKKTQRFTFALIRALKDKYGNDVEGLAKCADALLKIASDPKNTNQLKAITEIRDTLQGKPTQTLAGDKENPLIVPTFTINLSKPE